MIHVSIDSAVCPSYQNWETLFLLGDKPGLLEWPFHSHCDISYRDPIPWDPCHRSAYMLVYDIVLASQTSISYWDVQYLMSGKPLGLWV
jgi:hypothetical protein